MKAAAASALRWTGTDALVGAWTGARSTPLILGYHRVVDDLAQSSQWCIPAMLVTPQMLECHLDWVGRYFQFASLDEIGALLQSGEKADRPLAAITFDDGYRDVYYNAFPILKRKGIPAAFFVVTGLAGTEETPIHDRLYLLLKAAFARRMFTPRTLAGFLSASCGAAVAGETAYGLPQDPFVLTRRLLHRTSQAGLIRVIEALESRMAEDSRSLEEMLPMTWEMIAEMHAAGMTIGSHSRTHALLTNEDAGKVIEETRGSRETLQQRLGVEIDHFAYPDGRLSPRVASAVLAAGYRYAYATGRRRDAIPPLMKIPRRVLWQNSCVGALGRFSPAIMSCQVNGVFDSPWRREERFAKGCPRP